MDKKYFLLDRAFMRGLDPTELNNSFIYLWSANLALA